MTVSSTQNRKSNAGNGVTTAFSFPYYFLVDSDLVVLSVNDTTGVSTTLALTTDYTVAGAGDAAGGTVNTLVPPATGVTLVIYRDPAKTQLTDFVNNDDLDAATLESAFDRLTMVVQRQDDIIARSMRFPDSDPASSIDNIPNSVTRANHTLIFDTDGKPAAGSITTDTINAAMSDVVNAASHAAGRQLLMAGMTGRVTTDGSGNLIEKTPVTQMTADYPLVAGDHGGLLSFYLTTAAATATCLSSGAAGNGYKVRIFNLYASTKALTLAVASGNGFYHLNGTNDSTLTLLPGESCELHSTGNVYIVDSLIRQNADIAGGFKNLKVVTADASKAPIVTADMVTVENSTGRAMRLPSLNVTMDFNSTGAGKLDTGSIAAAKAYYLWAIAKEDRTASVLGSLSSTSPVMPVGYTFKSLIGAVITKQGAATFLGTLQQGRKFQYTQPQIVATGVQGTYSTTTPTWLGKTVAADAGSSLLVPALASAIVLNLNGNLASGTSAVVYAAPNAGYGGYQSTNPPPLVGGAVNGAIANGVLLLEAATIQIVSSNTQGGIYCNGWEMNL